MRVSTSRKFNATTAQKVLDAISAGQTLRTASALSGVSHVAVYYWLNRGRAQRHGRYRDFLEAFEQAKAQAEIPLVNAVRRCAVGGVFRVPVYDADGRRLVDESTGAPVFREVVVMPNGLLCLRLLAVYNPRDWGGKSAPQPEEQRPRAAPGETINLFLEAFEVLADHGIRPPAELVAKLSAPRAIEERAAQSTVAEVSTASRSSGSGREGLP
jgi:hypothetical protein